MVNLESELDVVKREIAELKQEIDDVKARVKLLEGIPVRSDDEKDELKQKREKENLLLANLDKLRAEKARLVEERQQQPRDPAGTSFFILLLILFFFFFFMCLGCREIGFSHEPTIFGNGS